MTLENFLNQVYQGNNLDWLRQLPDNSIDSLVTDPPYSYDPLMSQTWDGADPRRDEKDKKAYQQRIANGVNYNLGLEGNKRFQEWTEEWAREVFRVLKPGAHGLVFGATKTDHRPKCGLEDAGFVVRETLVWGYATGTPKGNRDITNDLKQLGVTEPTEGMGTILKPAAETITLIRKPITEPTVAENVLKWGTGALYIDEARVPWEKPPAVRNLSSKDQETIVNKNKVVEANPLGRWPATIVLTDEILGDWNKFYMCAKPNRKEKSHDGKVTNEHSTVKPLHLMRQLIRLVTPKDGICLDPFAGSGTTLVACKQVGVSYVGLEKEQKSVDTAIERLVHTSVDN